MRQRALSTRIALLSFAARSPYCKFLIPLSGNAADRPFELRYEDSRVAANSVHVFEELDDIQSPISILKFAHERLTIPEYFGNADLSDTPRLTLSTGQVEKHLITWMVRWRRRPEALHARRFRASCPSPWCARDGRRRGAAVSNGCRQSRTRRSPELCSSLPQPWNEGMNPGDFFQGHLKSKRGL